MELLIDGTNDRCSRGEDINFQFTGFGVVGKVVSKGQTDGPAGVTLTLSKLGSTEVIKETTSEVGGSYGFERVLPGEYSVTAKHPSWTFDQVCFINGHWLLSIMFHDPILYYGNFFFVF